MAATIQLENMKVSVLESNHELGRAAAADVANVLRDTISSQGEAAIILATGNSQLSFLHALRNMPNIDWDCVTVFQMDEYLGISSHHPASFRRFHRTHLTDIVHPRTFYGIEGDAADVNAEMARYTALLQEHQPVACVMGIGENGHLAFNDPPADFETPNTIHLVTLDEASRRQQVGEGHFSSIDEVPRQALTLTVPALLKPPHVFVVVPERRKARAVKAALEGPITPECPASILRTMSKVKLYLDRDSASLVTNFAG